ncbi:hypothetical protein E2C01_076551 [Portunus trituberculatus]|uniref:Uncharacterized protein n=1 Tax=Portunus trituberculatus TaxID=210409 RepID=A0A5B7IDH7_PORTR|nr:hypothetical protein [Portunus trituberculatus]
MHFYQESLFTNTQVFSSCSCSSSSSSSSFSFHSQRDILGTLQPRIAGDSVQCALGLRACLACAGPRGGDRRRG